MTNVPKILFLCTGNSARSILCEYILRYIAPGRFEAHSAGVHPTGKVNPLVLRVLKETFRINPSNARSKSYKAFEGVNFDFVITVCDQAREHCPVWLGQPLLVHWDSPDPSTFTGTKDEKLKKVGQLAVQIQRRLSLFTSLPIEKMERLKLQQAMQGIS